MKRHPLDESRRPDLTKLREILSERMGRRVEILTGDGALILEHPDTGEHLDADGNLVASAIQEVERGPLLTLEEQAIARIDEAKTVGGKINAIREYFQGQVDAKYEARARADWAERAVRMRLAAERGSNK